MRKISGRAEIAGALLLAALSTTCAAADYGSQQCAMGDRKWDVTTTMCIPQGPKKTWIVCSGFPGRDGGGLWKDSGVPCTEKSPRSPAEYRPVRQLPHPPPPAPEAKRVIDQFGGVFFTCVPTPVQWTKDACAQITKEWVRQAEAAKEPHAVVDLLEDDAAVREKAKAAGIAPDSEMRWMMVFKNGEKGAVSLVPNLAGVVEVVPGIYAERQLILGGDIHMDADQASAANALAAAKGLFEGYFTYLLGPR